MLSTTVLSHYCTTIALSDHRKNSLLWLTKCFPALHEWGLLMHLPHPSQGSQHCSSHSCFSGRRWSETDKGRLQTPASLEVSKICYAAVRWIRYFLRELEYFRGTICIWTGIQILPNTTSEEHLYMGKSDWWISGGCRIGSILSSGSRLWIKKLDSEPPLLLF